MCQVEGTAWRCEDEIDTREQQRCGPPSLAGTATRGGGLLSGNTSQESRKVVRHRLLARASAWGGRGRRWKGEGPQFRARLDTSVLQRARMETFGPFEHSDWVKGKDGGEWDFFTSSGAGTIGQRGPTLQSIPASFLLLLRKC